MRLQRGSNAAPMLSTVLVYTNEIRMMTTLLQKRNKKWIIIDIAVPADQNIVETQNEKVDTNVDTKNWH